MACFLPTNPVCFGQTVHPRGQKGNLKLDKMTLRKLRVGWGGAGHLLQFPSCACRACSAVCCLRKPPSQPAQAQPCWVLCILESARGAVLAEGAAGQILLQPDDTGRVRATPAAVRYLMAPSCTEGRPLWAQRVSSPSCCLCP